MGVLGHFNPWGNLGLGSVRTFWGQKLEKKIFLKFTKILSYMKSLCIFSIYIIHKKN